MSESSSWDLLPANPIAFFGLKQDFDRKDLKRAYGRLIRQFKPETHPAEFQQIRKAYETLESENRYGLRQSEVSRQSQAWEIQTTVAQATGSRRKGPKIQADTVSDFDLAVSDPKKTYARIAKQERRSPQDFFLLATLSDLVDRDSSNMYLKWLLTGLKEHKSDPGLQRLLSEYLSAFSDGKSGPSTLLIISKVVQGADFYRITERLWERMLEENEFSIVAKTLNACEANLKHRDLKPRLAFLVHFLRRASAKAPRDWLESQLRFLEQHGSELDVELENDIEFLNLVQKYYASDRENILYRPLGKSIDAMIEAYCKGSSDAIQQVSTICDELARNGNGVIDSFPYEQDEHGQNVLILCHIIASEVSFETGVEFGNAKEERIQMQADAVVGDIEKSLGNVGSQIQWMKFRHYGFPFLVLWLGPLILTYGFDYWFMVVLIWTAMSVMLMFGVINPFFLTKKAEDKTQKIALRAYETTWRPRLFRYVQACHAPSEHSIGQLHKSAHELGRGELMEAVLSYAFQDSAIQLFSRLQPFVH